MPEESEEQRWLDKITDGGLPQLLLGPAGKAISRLLGAGVEIPAAWLEQKAQAIRDETDARRTVMEELAAKSVELGLEDRQLLERGLDNLLGRVYREQRNRDAIARQVVEELESNPAPETSEGPRDDWLDLFESYASRASSENLRSLFGKILAGEIRKPGKFSPATLHFASMLDLQTAQMIDAVLPWCIDDSFILKGPVGTAVHYGEWLVLEEAGFVTFGGGKLRRTITPNQNQIAHFRMGKQVIGVLFPDNESRNLNAIKLTKAGGELASAVSTSFQVSAVAEWFWSQQAEEVHVGDVVFEAGAGKMVITNSRQIPRPGEPSNA
ncbi:DUF2806 domain-containing protein [Chelativorans sp. YIM 93263]|uniref:DUF2806 domain-containing protein n=1 Tax=Chelativorans sp. YIM 93263 TaxID=2906648 RepID=UPI0023784C6E|nr:DUF2806 domain-containing protein [Chelativorans sp. YIM 93263]